ncbi:Retrotransposon gag protein [Salix suchowensis]|nr:Retrotransposon gag protein [Salix suchowensis]
MENGGHERKLADKLSGLSLNNNNDSSHNDNNSLFQVMKAVEAAEATIRQQVEENTLLRSELQSKIQQLEKYKIDEPVTERSRSPDQWNEQVHQSASSAVAGDPTSVLVPNNGDPATQSHLWKQDFALKVHENEEEITQLRKHLAEYSVKEAQIRNEKYVLEKRIAYMRLAFDQQQQDLVDAASKALSYRQDIIEENIRLTYELQAAQQERSAFVSSLLPLLKEYSLQPLVTDAQSIVSNVKVLFRHLQEKLIHTESKLKESQYQLAPWRSDVNHSNFAPQSPSHAALSKSGLELVPQPPYSHGKIPMTSSDTQTAADWDPLSHHQSGLADGAEKNLDLDDVGRYSPLASRNSAAHDTPAHFTVTRGDAQAIRYGEETTNKQVMFRDPVNNSEMDYPEAEVQLDKREPQANWGSGNPIYSNTLDDPGSSFSPFLPPVLEEPSSSVSEAADDDPLPAIEGLQISGEALPGRELQASGYSINGTTSCNFEWVRHLEDGSVNYIEGAKQPNYLVTADDVETYLAIEVQPLDDRKRKGEIVKVFANEHKKIRYDPEMHEHIQKIVYSGHVSYKIGLWTRFIDIWEPATLAIKREGYSIKSDSGGVVVTEKFSQTISVTIPYGHALEFILTDSAGHQHLLQADDSSTDINYARDTIVLTLRLFIKQFGERRKGKKRGLFFGK